MDSVDCDLIFGARNIEKVETFKISGGNADFGDEPHVGGVPQGTAVVCWLTDGRVAILGKLYSDNFRDLQSATIWLRFRRSNGALTGPRRRSVNSHGYWVASRSVEVVSPDGTFTEAIVRLSYYQVTALGPTGAVVGNRNFAR
jgi:hypothetical protein